MIAAAVFTVAPYRIEHFMHLELQWTVWMPLSIWALHRTFDEGTLKWGALTGLFLWLQFISCVYYGAYLGLIVARARADARRDSAAAGRARHRAARPGRRPGRRR